MTSTPRLRRLPRTLRAPLLACLCAAMAAASAQSLNAPAADSLSEGEELVAPPPAPSQPPASASAQSGSEPEAGPAEPSFFEGVWNGFSFDPDASRSSGPLAACESRVSSAEGQARARSGSLDLGALISSERPWRLLAQAGSGEWSWSAAPSAGPDRAALSGPGFACALARPAAFRAALARARDLAPNPRPGSLALIGFEISQGAIGRPCAAELSSESALIRLGSEPELHARAERLAFERPAPPQSAGALFYHGASARLSGPPGSRQASLFIAPSPSSPGALCQLASPSWWDGMAPAAEPAPH